MHTADPVYKKSIGTKSFGNSENLTFETDIHTTLKHSNATQNIYFSNYFEWQGMCRERWFFECISPDMLQDQGVFITKSAHNDYIKEAFPFQTITCRMNASEIKKCSFKLLFRFYIEDEMASEGYQTIVFANHEKRITKLPASVIERVKQYELPTQLAKYTD